MNRLITLSIGDIPYWNLCRPAMQSYADALGVELEVITSYGETVSRLHPKVPLLDMLLSWGETAADADRLVFLDADIYVTPKTPNLFLVDKDLPPGNVWAQRAFSIGNTKNFATWFQDTYNTAIDSRFVYCNTGLMMFDGLGVRRMKQWLGPPYIRKVLEQHQMNAAMLLSGCARLLPDIWQLPPKRAETEPHYCVHFLGEDKVSRIRAYLRSLPA